MKRQGDSLRLGTRRLPRGGQRDLRQPGGGGRPREWAVARRRAPRAPLLGEAYAPPHPGYARELGLRSTFFVEGLNAELYPEALLEIANSGHELGYHGWRHEYWPDLSPSDEARLLERGVHKMDELGVRPRGFRPPGGRLTPSSPELLENLGFTHCSPAGRGIGFLDNLVVLPFEWRLIDAYHYLPRFGGLRETSHGIERAAVPGPLPGDAKLGAAGHRPRRRAPNPAIPSFLEDQEDRFEIMRGALEAVRDLVQDGLVWCAPYRDVVSWVRERPGAFGNGLQLDPTQT